MLRGFLCPRHLLVELVRYFHIVTLSLQSCSCPCCPVQSPSPTFWHVSCVATRTSTLQHSLHQKTRPNETSVLASAPTCHDSTSFSNTASSNKGLGYTQNFGKKSERGRPIMNQLNLSLISLSLISLFSHLSLSLSFSLSHSLTLSLIFSFFFFLSLSLSLSLSFFLSSLISHLSSPPLSHLSLSLISHLSHLSCLISLSSLFSSHLSHLISSLSSHLISSHLISSHLISSHLISSHLTLSSLFSLLSSLFSLLFFSLLSSLYSLFSHLSSLTSHLSPLTSHLSSLSVSIVSLISLSLFTSHSHHCLRSVGHVLAHIVSCSLLCAPFWVSGRPCVTSGVQTLPCTRSLLCSRTKLAPAFGRRKSPPALLGGAVVDGGSNFEECCSED